MGPPLIGVSHSIERIRELIKHVTDTGLNILITGESGVGKEVVANNLYYSSSRRNKPFVKINCAALPEGLLESELFGYERGAFTGAERKRRGKFEIAHEGVLFLDEIGDMALTLQSKLLHVLQSGEFAPLGSEKEIKTDTWVIAATNQDLEQRIKEGKFREDLYYRLNIIKIDIPPLRNRPEDIPPLIEYYIEAYNSQFNTKQLSKPNKQIMEKLMAYHWPGNIRELQNILRRLMVVYSWEEIIDELLIKKSSVGNINTAESFSNKTSITADLFDLKGEDSPNNSSFSLKKIRKKTLDIVEKEVISNVLQQTGWNRLKAAKILKISYKTLLYKIQDLNITPQQD
ncbi:MAG: sigma-54-dependent Fis family transcriptional regulator [Desulfobacterales bacterium]|nr:sigma-54-dependent Fis family transcriptional regulator [Desulfobacterales bacterium]